MSIVDALQKAKQAQQRRRADDRAAESAESERAQGAAPGAVASSDRRAPVLEPLEPINPVWTPLDAERCAANRVLAPGRVDDAGNRGAAGAYDMLRTRVLHRARTHGWNTIGLTSAGQNDGKTLTAVNLALSLARERNSEVVLLDLDMRNPSVCKALGIESRRDLIDYFKGEADPRDVFMSVGVENLFVAGNVHNSQEAAELLASSKLPELLSFVRRSTKNPIILVDLPPVLLTDDALIVAPHLDAMLLVVSEGATPRSSLSRARDLLSDFKLAGYVLNKSSESIGGSEYGYGYAYSKNK